MDEIPRVARNDNKKHCHSELCLLDGHPKNLKLVITMYYVYLLSNKTNTVLYTGVTNDLERRLYEHKNKLIDGFTKRYNIDKLVYFEETNDVYSAITREKQIKGWSRAKKNDLINSINPQWTDLSINNE